MMINEKCFAPLRWALMRSGKNFCSFKKKKVVAAEGNVMGLYSSTELFAGGKNLVCVCPLLLPALGQAGAAIL